MWSVGTLDLIRIIPVTIYMAIDEKLTLINLVFIEITEIGLILMINCIWNREQKLLTAKRHNTIALH